MDTLEFAGGEISAGDFLGPIASTECNSSVTEALLDGIAELEWDIFSANEILLGSPLHVAIERFARKQKLHLRRTNFRVCPFLTLPSNFEDYLKALPKTVRYNYRRATKELPGLNARVEKITESSEIQKQLPELIRLSAARWEAKGKTSSLLQTGVTAFLISLSSALKDPVVLYRIAGTEDRTAAMLLVFYLENTAFYYQAGFDPQSNIAKYSPGVLLIGTAIRDCIESGIEYFEFLRGDEPYKTDWTSEARVTGTIQIARGRTGQSWLTLMYGKDTAKAAIRSIRSPGKCER